MAEKDTQYCRRQKTVNDKQEKIKQTNNGLNERTQNSRTTQRQRQKRSRKKIEKEKRKNKYLKNYRNERQKKESVCSERDAA